MMDPNERLNGPRCIVYGFAYALTFWMILCVLLSPWWIVIFK